MWIRTSLLNNGQWMTHNSLRLNRLDDVRRFDGVDHDVSSAEIAQLSYSRVERLEFDPVFAQRSHYTIFRREVLHQPGDLNKTHATFRPTVRATSRIGWFARRFDI